MTNPRLIVVLALTLAGRAAAQDFRVLVFSKTAGFRHDSIPAGIAAIQNLGVQSSFAVEASEDAAQFAQPNLSRFRVVVFLCTTGEVTFDAADTRTNCSRRPSFRPAWYTWPTAGVAQW